MISASIGCDDRESPSIGVHQRRSDVPASADSLTPHRIDSDSTGAIASASVDPHESALGWSREEAGVAEMAASTADQVGA